LLITRDDTKTVIGGGGKKVSRGREHNKRKRGGDRKNIRWRHAAPFGEKREAMLEV